MSNNTGRHASTLSITVLLEPLTYEYPKADVFDPSKVNFMVETSATATLWTALRKLPAQLHLMSNLSTFSLRVQGYHDKNRPYGFWLQSRDIQAIVEALPRTVSGLELDSHCFDRLDSDASMTNYHICPLLGSMLPCLTALRLRLSRLCEDLITVKDECEPATPETLVRQQSTSEKAHTTILVNTIDFESTTSLQPCHAPLVDQLDGLKKELRCRELIGKLLQKSATSWDKTPRLEPINISFVEIYGSNLHGGQMSKRSYSAITKRSLIPPNFLPISLWTDQTRSKPLLPSPSRFSGPRDREL